MVNISTKLKKRGVAEVDLIVADQLAHVALITKVPLAKVPY